MKKSILNKDIWLSFRQSKGRFLSIMFLMMLGSFALVGLKMVILQIRWLEIAQLLFEFFLRQLIFLSSSLSQVIFQARKIKWLWLVFIKESTRLAIALL